VEKPGQSRPAFTANDREEGSGVHAA
jgi:hypothetical protein